MTKNLYIVIFELSKLNFKNMHNQTSTIQINLTLEQIAATLQKLSPKKKEELDLLLDKKLQKKKKLF